LENSGAPVNDEFWLRAGTTILVNGRWLPPAEKADATSPCMAWVGDQLAYAVLSAEQTVHLSPRNLEDSLETWKNTLPQRSADGYFINFPWDLVEQNSKQLSKDFERFAPSPTHSPDGPFAVVGPKERISVHPTAHIDPMVVIDTQRGPVMIDRKAVVHAFSR